MKNNSKNLFASFVFLSIVLIGIVPLVDLIIVLFMPSPNGLNESVQYANNEIMSGIVSEVIRALITVYLYSTTENKGISILHGIKYGLLYSALIASLYIILGRFYFQLKNPLQFVVVDTAILFVQGVSSGIVLFYTFRKKTTNASH